MTGIATMTREVNQSVEQVIPEGSSSRSTGAPTAPTSIGKILVAGYLVVGIGLVGFLLWAVSVPLSSAVITPGVVKVDTNRKAIQHLEGGIVEEIRVRDGDRVAAGEVLILLDGTRAVATLSVLESSQDAALAQDARLRAERDGRSSIEFPAILLSRGQDPSVAELLKSQRALFAARRASMTGEMEILSQQIDYLQQDITGLNAQLRSKERQKEIAGGELSDLRGLVSRGLSDKMRLLTLERELADLEGDRGELLSGIASANSQIAEKELRQLQIEKGLHEEVVSELRKLQMELLDLAERTNAARHTVEHTEIRAPVAGTVVDLRAHTEGGVVAAGETLLEIVPAADRLIVEAKVRPEDIEGVRVGLAAGVKFSALKQRSTPEVNGVVRYVAADIVEDPRSGVAYFVSRIEVSDEELKRLGGIRIQPGMFAEVFIRTGERTPAQYLLQPLLDSFRRAWREQ